MRKRLVASAAAAAALAAPFLLAAPAAEAATKSTYTRTDSLYVTGAGGGRTTVQITWRRDGARYLQIRAIVCNGQDEPVTSHAVRNWSGGNTNGVGNNNHKVNPGSCVYLGNGNDGLYGADWKYDENNPRTEVDLRATHGTRPMQSAWVYN